MCVCVYNDIDSKVHIDISLCSPKIAVHVLSAPESKSAGPSVLQKAGFIRLSFRRGGQEEVNTDVHVFISTELELESRYI